MGLLFVAVNVGTSLFMPRSDMSLESSFRGTVAAVIYLCRVVTLRMTA